MAEAYLLAGQVHEMLGLFREALADYEQAYRAADASEHLELAAMARMRTAMLMQMMNNPAFSTTPQPTASP
jgi:hypothetical protein